MDYAEMVSQIMAAEQGAKVLAEESRARRQQLQAGLDEEISAMRERYLARARQRLAVFRQRIVARRRVRFVYPKRWRKHYVDIHLRFGQRPVDVRLEESGVPVSAIRKWPRSWLHWRSSSPCSW